MSVGRRCAAAIALRPAPSWLRARCAPSLGPRSRLYTRLSGKARDSYSRFQHKRNVPFGFPAFFAADWFSVRFVVDGCYPLSSESAPLPASHWHHEARRHGGRDPRVGSRNDGFNMPAAASPHASTAPRSGSRAGLGLRQSEASAGPTRPPPPRTARQGELRALFRAACVRPSDLAEKVPSLYSMAQLCSHT